MSKNVSLLNDIKESVLGLRNFYALMTDTMRRGPLYTHGGNRPVPSKTQQRSRGLARAKQTLNTRLTLFGKHPPPFLPQTQFGFLPECVHLFPFAPRRDII